MIEKTNKGAMYVEEAGGGTVSMMAEIDATPMDILPSDLLKELPILPLRNAVMFPEDVLPVTVGRPSTMKLLKYALRNKSIIVIATQKTVEVEEPELNDLYPVCVVGRVLRIFEMSGGSFTALLQSNGPKARLDTITAHTPFLKGEVLPIVEDMVVEANDNELKILEKTCREYCMKYIELSEQVAPDVAFAIRNITSAEMLANFIGSNFPLAVEDKMELLSIDTLKGRLYRLNRILDKENQLAMLK